MTAWHIVGASGFIGSALVSRLKAQGFEVTTAVAPRLSSAVDTDPAGLFCAAMNHPAVEELVGEMRGKSVVVNTAGIADSGARQSSNLIGANSLLPVIVALAAVRAEVPRMVHLSSAAVQGRSRTLDDSQSLSPFSPYSRSKALAERALWILQNSLSVTHESTSVVILRATSIYAINRETSATLERVARSPLASVAAPGDQPSPVASLDGLLATIVEVGTQPECPPPIVLQASEGATVTSVLSGISGRAPKVLPICLCKAILRVAWALSRVAGPRWISRVRQLELMWLGQEQTVADSRRA
jgi:dTDP-4-dehydrorhamnose reductase